MGLFFTKNLRQSFKPSIKMTYETENNIQEDKNVMTTKEKIEMAREILSNDEESKSVKKIKKDKGLIERAESSKTVITEDNKELLKD